MTRCECGRPARFFTRHDRHFRMDKKHGLCGSCFRRMMEAQNVKDRETRRRTIIEHRKVNEYAEA